jgi:hypothetical protein
MLIDRVRRYVPEPAAIPPSVTSLEGRGFRAKGGGALWFLRIAIRRTADVFVQMHVRRNEMAAQADIQRLFANDPHLMRDIGLFDHNYEPAEIVAVARREQLWTYDRLRAEP